ncbi:MAG: alpha/beta fold hydrolase [Deltaproteobacteria bacterium]|nr:alpha/beta fold hydrolase [Deltaproteobacteria bacterium]
MFSKYVTIDGVAVNYFHTGASTLPGTPPALDQGELLLFAHGAGSNAHTWHRQLAHVAAAHSGVALDFPGHGRSGSTEGLPDLAAHVRCVAAFADQVARRPVVFVGRALGGAVGLGFAAAHPERLRALVLVATPARFAIPPASLDTWHAVTMGRATQPFDMRLFAPGADMAVVRECFMEQVKTDPRVRYTDLLAGNGLDFTAQLGALRVPTLVITGRHDHFCPPDKAEDVQRAIPGAQLAVIENAGHMLTSEQPDAFNAAVDAFLATLPPIPSPAPAGEGQGGGY